MIEFFNNSILCFILYLLVLVLLVLAIFIKKLKNYFLLGALLVFIADISYLLVLGFSLQRCAIICGICLSLVLISIMVGRKE